MCFTRGGMAYSRFLAWQSKARLKNPLGGLDFVIPTLYR